MLRHPVKPAINHQVEQFQSAGGQIRPATNSGKLTIGQQAERDRARRRSVKGRAA